VPPAAAVLDRVAEGELDEAMPLRLTGGRGRETGSAGLARFMFPATIAPADVVLPQRRSRGFVCATERRPQAGGLTKLARTRVPPRSRRTLGRPDRSSARTVRPTASSTTRSRFRMQ
jgi:hypothetical protein